MLLSLTIQNYALISRLEIDFNKGFSVLTGETGAGKSIILGALSLILGQRADSRSIKEGANKCVIEGIFDISSYHMQTYFLEKEWEYDPIHCIIRREIYSNGKSRAFINDAPVALPDLKELVSLLIDVHSQHQNLLLGDDRFQMRVLDALAGSPELFSEYRDTYNEYSSLQKQLNALKKEAESGKTEEDYLRFQVVQLEEAALIPGEQSDLEQEIETLSHTEEIKSELFRVSQLLSEEEHGAVTTLKEAATLMQSIQKMYPPAGEMAERMQTAYLDIKDLAREVEIREEGLEYDPQRLQTLNERLDLIYSLQQKHRVSSVEELIDIRESMEKKLQSIDNFDEQIETLEKQLKKLDTTIQALADQITGIRHEAAQKLEVQLIEKVRPLGLADMRFSCRMDTRPHPDSTGMDTITFLFSANKNTSLLPVSQIASGGEISRLMLGIKALIADAIALPTIIFDEIDTGVSGEMADKMGTIMKNMGSVMQVVAITHLPQIAAKGDAHYYVYKQNTDHSTETHIRQLTPEERIKEIAQMLSGSELSEAAVANARELLGTNK